MVQVLTLYLSYSIQNMCNVHNLNTVQYIMNCVHVTEHVTGQLLNTYLYYNELTNDEYTLQSAHIKLEGSFGENFN